MALVTEDIIQGNAGRLTISGWEFSRQFTVSELTSAGYAMLVEAVSATNIPIGDPHPAIPLAKAIEFDPESIPTSGNQVRVTILYREFSQDYRTELGSRVLTTEQSEYLLFPNASPGSDTAAMKLEYVYPDDYKLDPEKAGTRADDQGVTIDRQDYYPTIIITRTEFSTIEADTLSGWTIGVTLTGEILTDRMLKYNGRTNEAGWNIRPDDGEHLWRCELTAASAEEGLAYRVRYVFSYDPDKWKNQATYIDPLSGQPVPDPSDAVSFPGGGVGKSIKTFDQFYAQDFSLLGLT